MKLFLFILLSLIFINGTKSELNTTILSISIYNNDFELFENIIEREKRESNSLIESNKEENDNNSKDPINENKQNDNNSKKEIQAKTKEDIIQNDNKNDDTKTQIIDRVNLIRKLPNFEKLADQEVRGDFGIHKMEKGSNLEGYFTADFKKGESARILMRYNDDTIEVYGLVDTHNTDKSGKKLPEKNVFTEKELKNIRKSDPVFYNNVANSNKYLKVKSDKNQHVFVKLYEKPFQKISKY